MLPYVKGKRLNFSPDLASTRDFSSSLKALASGQDVTGRKIYGEAEKVKAPPLCFALNEYPAFRDVTDGFFRRVLLFSFEVQIPPEKQDRGLVGKICETDLPGIFNWVMKGRGMLLRQKGEFTRSEKMEENLKKLRADYIYEADKPVKAYLESRGLTVFPQYRGQPTMLISRNEISHGLRDTVSPTAITRELTSYGVKLFRSGSGLKYRVYEITYKKK